MSTIEYNMNGEEVKKLANSPEVQAKLQGALVEMGLKCRQEASVEGNRWNKLQAVMDLMTPEGQRAFLEGRSGTGKMILDALAKPITMAFIVPIALRKYFRVITLPPEDLSLNDFSENEILALVAVGGIQVEESVARAVEQGLANRIGFAKTIGWIALLVPGAGHAISEAVHTLASVGEIPVEIAAQLLPQVRAEVNRENIVRQEQVRIEEEAVAATVDVDVVEGRKAA
jgi:hypothetical protein